jgi:zinc protease
MYTLPLLALAAVTSAAADTPPAAYTVPISYYKLDNGLKVVLSKDTTAPLVTVAVYYNIGFRNEPKNRTGFAHLFEHMMFQGSNNLPKGEFDKLTNGNGGMNNGSTRFDFTNYYEVVPSHVLEPILWAEGDRMKGLLLTPANLLNQQGVVSNEVLGNVLNQPYGGFPWLDMPQYANKNWFNAHNFYGDLKDLEAATLEDVREFFRLFYAPNNAVLSIVGDFDEAQARQWVKKYFAGIPSVPRPAAPDLSEPKQTEEKRFTKSDKLAKRPALGVSYHVPERNTPEHLAMVMLASILGEGDDALLKEELVKKKGYTSNVGAGINLLGNAFNYKGPMLWTVSLFHDPATPADKILESMDGVIKQIQDNGVTKTQVDRALVKFRSRWYANLSSGMGRADVLSCFALFDDAPEKANQVEASMRSVTPALIQKVATDYLRKTNRTILTIVPGEEEGGKK